MPAKVTDKEKEDVNQAVCEERVTRHALGAGEQPSAAGTLDSAKSSVSPTQSMIDEAKHFRALKNMVKSLDELKEQLDQMKTPAPTPAASPAQSPRNLPMETVQAGFDEVDYGADESPTNKDDEQTADAGEQTEISQEAVNSALANS